MNRIVSDPERFFHALGCLHDAKLIDEAKSKARRPCDCEIGKYAGSRNTSGQTKAMNFIISPDEGALIAAYIERYARQFEWGANVEFQALENGIVRVRFNAIREE